MNWDQIKGKWEQAKGNMRAKWGDLTDDEIAQIEGNREVLVGKLQERYGMAKDQAEREADDWARSL